MPPVPNISSKRAAETILVAEDDPIFRRLLKNRLQSWGYIVVTVENGAAAWEYLQKPDPPDLLILDWIMPGMDGLDLCRRIRDRQQDPYQYILLVSGKDEKQDIVKGLDAGADDYLTKPFDIGELRARLRAGKRILSLQNELIQAREALRYQANHDALTGLWSRGPALRLLETELHRGIRAKTATGLLMIDIDHFKQVNDTYGHLSGDAVLHETARRISEAVRAYDFVGRYGGEEFIAVLSRCNPDELSAVAERIRSSVAATPISSQAGPVSVTVSLGGVVTSKAVESPELLSAADAALYEAKRTGRNRAVVGSCDCLLAEGQQH